MARGSATPRLGRNGSFRLIESGDVDFMIIFDGRTDWMNALANAWNGANPACRGARQIFVLTTCYAHLDVRVRPGAVVLLARLLESVYT